jgi:hypothetical protein
MKKKKNAPKQLQVSLLAWGAACDGISQPMTSNKLQSWLSVLSIEAFKPVIHPLWA